MSVVLLVAQTSLPPFEKFLVLTVNPPHDIFPAQNATASMRVVFATRIKVPAANAPGAHFSGGEGGDATATRATSIMGSLSN